MSPSGVEDLLVELLDPAPGGHGPTPGPPEGADRGVGNCLLPGPVSRPVPWLCTHPGSRPLRRWPLDTGSFARDGTVREGSFSSKDPVCFTKPRQQRPVHGPDMLHLGGLTREEQPLPHRVAQHHAVVVLGTDRVEGESTARERIVRPVREVVTE